MKNIFKYFQFSGKIFGSQRLQREIARLLNTLGLKEYSELLWIDLGNKHKVDRFLSSPQFMRASAHIDLDGVAYFLFHASFGDKWLILSFLEPFLTIYPKTRIVASETDKNLIRIFLGETRVNACVIFLPQEAIVEFSNNILPGSFVTAPIVINPGTQSQTDDLLASGFPAGILRHMHLVKYPYFSDLLLEHGVSYAALQKMILYLPSEVKSVRPCYFKDDDISTANNIILSRRHDGAKAIVLFNIYNITHLGLTNAQIDLILRAFETRGIQVFINVTQYPLLHEIESIISSHNYACIINIPGHLYSLVSQGFDGVFGVMGGAMNVTVQFSDTHCLSLHAASNSFKKSIYTIFGARFSDTKENVWRFYDQDWPSLSAGRFIENVDIDNPADFPDEKLKSLVLSFSDEVVLPQKQDKRPIPPAVH